MTYQVKNSLRQILFVEQTFVDLPQEVIVCFVISTLKIKNSCQFVLQDLNVGTVEDAADQGLRKT